MAPARFTAAARAVGCQYEVVLLRTLADLVAVHQFALTASYFAQSRIFWIFSPIVTDSGLVATISRPSPAVSRAVSFENVV
jgi:hypothetical protein